MLLKGNSVSSGKNLGVLLLKKEIRKIEEELVFDKKAEMEKYHTAKEKSIQQIRQLYQRALIASDQKTAEIFEGHEMLIDDIDFVELIENNINENGYSAKYSIYSASGSIKEVFLSMDNEYMQQRASDILDISYRMIINLLDEEVFVSIEEGQKYILVADELFASDTLKFDRENLAGFVTSKGSYSSHSGILARTLNIPSLVGVDIGKLENGMNCLIDADNGELYIDPTEEQIKQYYEYKEEKEKEEAVYEEFKEREIIINGKKVEICANVGNEEEVALAMENGSDGIGLFRSEFLFIRSNKAPTEEEQFEAYKQALISANGKRLIVRTIDIGADKKVDYINIGNEDNPALGIRGIRISFIDIKLFKEQLKALYRASVFGKLAIMFPMIISVQEIKKIKSIILEVKAELDDEMIKYSDEIEIGIMIETPASVMIADSLAKEVDFFSIGTNDLTQYTLAIDRMNEMVSELYDYNHDAINLMIQRTIDAGHDNGIWVGVCGESASRLDLALKYIDMGIDELSITPSRVPNMKYDLVQNYKL